MKSITIIGNLGANAVRRMTSEGKELMSFNVAVSQSKGDAVWFNCIGTLREKLLPYLLKGQCVCIVGDLSAGVYNNKIELTINIDRCELCGAKPDQSSQDSASTQPSTTKVETY